MKRRTFLQAVGGAAGGIAAVGEAVLVGESAAEDRVAGVPRRVLGRTGQKLSVVGFPGLALNQCDQKRATEGVHKAFDRGINYFDVAPAYGSAEAKMGPALEGIPRDRYFLACKTKKRDKAGAREELERSLKLLKTDHFDLYQLHHLRFPDEVKQALGPDGAMEAIVAAQKEGKLKYIGFSAHTTKGALAAMKGFRFDTAMFPISFVELLTSGFGRAVLELAKEQGVAVLAIKGMSRGLWPKGVEQTRKWWYRSVETPEEVDMAIRWTLSQPNVVAAIPPSFLDLLDKAIEAAKRLQPVAPAETEKLREIARSCESLFQREEAAVAYNRVPQGPVFPDSPHEGCCAWDRERSELA